MHDYITMHNRIEKTTRQRQENLKTATMLGLYR